MHINLVETDFSNVDNLLSHGQPKPTLLECVACHSVDIVDGLPAIRAPISEVEYPGVLTEPLLIAMRWSGLQSGMIVSAKWRSPGGLESYSVEWVAPSHINPANENMLTLQLDKGAELPESGSYQLSISLNGVFVKTFELHVKTDTRQGEIQSGPSLSRFDPDEDAW
tara:strand:+ start:406 stop:906 length:501 start_codon:yes stop_codon:yes gene_type:complete